MSPCHLYTNSPKFTNKLHPWAWSPWASPRALPLSGPEQSLSLYPHTLPRPCPRGGSSRHPHGTESLECSLLQAPWGAVSRAAKSPRAVPSRAPQSCAPHAAAASSSCPSCHRPAPPCHPGVLSRMQSQEENVFNPAFQTCGSALGSLWFGTYSPSS